MMPEFSRYERWCKSMGNFFTMKVGDKDKKKIDRAIDIAHLNVRLRKLLFFDGVVVSDDSCGVAAVVGIYLLNGGFQLMSFVLLWCWDILFSIRAKLLSGWR